VHIGARVAAMAGPSQILVSSTVKDLVAGSGLDLSIAVSTRSKAFPANGESSLSIDDLTLMP
jgi:class 3 adenylate cyclase